MERILEVQNVKCGGCASTLRKGLEDDFGEVRVELRTDPRTITLNIEESQMEALKLKLRSLGYPLVSDELTPFQEATTTAKSFVSCAIGKIDNKLEKK